MSVINVLSPHVADLIAAGEVVERPASVIKELIENSFDAGAGNVTVEIRDGGSTYIRITDNGCGMSPEDAGIASLRHATSKLKDEHGLDGISTMGFRGEALAAISSVCHMEIITREKGSEIGTRVVLDAGDIDDISPFGCPEGTTIICRDLFFNTPARLKFLKSDRSEASSCIAAAQRCALGRPEISVRFVRDGSEEFFTPGDGSIKSCLYSLLGRDEANGMLMCNSSFDSFVLKGFVSSPSQGRGNRSHQYFFVNGRNIKSPLLQTAVEQAYRNTLLVGKYPSCVLYLELPYGSVDVNVHPAKTEVRFGAEKGVFDFVYQAVKLALESEYSVPDSDPAENDEDKPIQHNEPKPAPCVVSNPSSACLQSGREVSFVPHFNENYSQQIMNDFSSFHPRHGNSMPWEEKNVENSVKSVEKPAVSAHKIIGEAFRTFIIVEQEDKIVLIDKHAAHERMVFDKLKSASSPVSSQFLLTPVTLHFSLEECEIAEKYGELLSEFGFEIEPFGESEFIVRSVPSDLDPAQTGSAVEEILDKIKSDGSPDPAEARDYILHTVACKSAIKAGWDTHRQELEEIVSTVLSGDVLYCPHGRPVSSVITRKDFDKLFKRIV